MSGRVYPSLASSQPGRKDIVILAIFYPLAVAAIVLRVSSRSIKGQALKFNDFAAFLALLCTTALAAVYFIGKFYHTLYTIIYLTLVAVSWAGARQHISDIEPQYRNRVFVLFLVA
jgi:hypothetical protein